jgi:hypothetical protein
MRAARLRFRAANAAGAETVEQNSGGVADV